MSKSKAYLGSAIVLYFVICIQKLLIIAHLLGFSISSSVRNWWVS